MPHDNKPHWAIRFKKALDRTRKKQRTNRFLLQCVLFRSNHLKAPLVKYQMLCDIFSDKLEDDYTRHWFWGVVNQRLTELSDRIDAEQRERLCRQIERRVPKPSAHLNAAVYRRPSIIGTPILLPPEEMKQTPSNEASNPPVSGLGTLTRRDSYLKSLVFDLAYKGSGGDKEAK